MQDVVLLVSTSAIFVFGYFLMNKLDVFLENNWNRQETALTYGENSLRIGFSNPLMAGGLADVGFDVVCYNIEKGNRFCLSDR